MGTSWNNVLGETVRMMASEVCISQRKCVGILVLPRLVDDFSATLQRRPAH